MVDNLSTDVQKQANTSYLEQRAVLQETTFPGTSLTMPSGIEAEMAETHWLARHQLTKPTQIDQVQWTTTQAAGTNLLSFTFPEILATVDSVIRRTLEMYAFYKLSPVFRFQLNATQFHQGQLIISFDPFRQALDPNLPITSANETNPIFSRYYATGLPSIKIMASESDPVELRIPYIHPKNFLSSNSEDPDVYNLMGEIRITVLNQLKVADGTTPSLTLTIWAYAEDASVHVPIQYHGFNAEPTSLIEPTSAISSLLQNGSNLIGNLVTGNIGKGLRSGQGVIDNLGELFGFDYPNRPIAPENTIKNVETLANARGATRSERLALDPVSGHMADREETTTNDEMDINTIIKMPMLIYQSVFASTDAPQSILYYIPVTPTLAADLGTYNGTPLSQPSYLAYLSDFFCFWRGSIQFDFEFVATRFHSGKIIVGFVPNFNPAGLNYQAISTATPSAVIDIQQTSKVSFVVPFQSTTPLKVTNLSSDSVEEQILGYLVVAVQNQLTHASNVASEIDINLYVRAGEDFTFLVPRRPELRYIYEAAQAIEATSDVTFQASRTGQEDSSSQAVLTHGQELSVPKPRFGETYAMIDCIRRFTPMIDQYSDVTLSLPTGGIPVNHLAVHPLLITLDQDINATPSVPNANPSYLSSFGKLFSCWSGSLRYKFLSSAPRTSDQSLTIYHIPDANWRTIPTGLGSQVFSAGYAAASTDLSQNTTLEVEIPYYSPFNFLLTQPTAVIAGGTSAFLNVYRYPYYNGFLQFRTTSDTVNSYRVYIAAGEDFKYFYLRSPPPDATINWAYVSTTPPSAAFERIL
nr:MAG: putative coat protein [Picornavirales sp.]